MNPPRLTTQLRVPALPAGLIERPRLVERMDRGTAGPITLVCGPPGCGKTALLCSWLRSETWSGSVAWVSLEPGDDEPLRFWDTVLAALRGVCDDSPVAALAGPIHDSRESFLPLLLNALAELPTPRLLVLDDLHVLRGSECLAQLAFVLRHLPPTLRIVLSGRADPALPLHVPRVLGTLTEIRAADLAFTRSEAASLMAAQGVGLDERLVGLLCERTEGWAAGLRLAALSLQGREDPERFITDFAGDDRVVADYLVAEVLDRQSPELRLFLLRTSIADRICGGLADAITSEPGGDQTLARLARANGFVIGLDDQGRWYRYHALFARLLQVRAHAELGPEVRALHVRAARWHATDGAIAVALRHSVAGEDWELAAELIAAHWFELFVRGQAVSMRTLMAHLPAERLAADAELSAAVACNLLDAGNAALAADHLRDAERAAASLPADRHRRLLELRAIARLYTARLEGDFGAALEVADKLLTEAGRHGGWSGDARKAFVHANLGQTALWAGHTERAGRDLDHAVIIAEAIGLEYLVVGTLGHRALLEVSCAGPVRAQRSIRDASGLAHRRGWAGISQLVATHLAAAAAALFELNNADADQHLARAGAALGGTGAVHLGVVAEHLAALLSAARDSPREGLALLDRITLPNRGWGLADPGMIELSRARLLIACADLTGAHESLERAHARSAPACEVAAARARMLLAAGDAHPALEALSKARLGHGPELGRTRVELDVLDALARDELGWPEVRVPLEHALAAAEATGHRSVFLDSGPRVGELLRAQIRGGTAHRALVSDLLDAFDDRRPARPAAGTSFDPLSDRERTIVRYLATSLATREIAAELAITTNTVKTHLRSIYRKLDVPDRRAAVKRARELRLISSGERARARNTGAPRVAA